jgi:hypothetical protein
MADIFKEVDEELKRDKAHKFWEKYRFVIFGVAAAVVCVTAGYQTWTWWDERQRSARSDRYAAAIELIERGDAAAAAEALGALGAVGGGYGTLAALKQAGLKIEAGEPAAAIEIWDRLANSSSAAPAFRGVATLLSVMHQMNEGDTAALEARLEPLIAPGSGFRPIALELIAVLALREGDTARARDLYTQIADDRTAPAGTQRRATRMLLALENQ